MALDIEIVAVLYNKDLWLESSANWECLTPSYCVSDYFLRFALCDQLRIINILYHS